MPENPRQHIIDEILAYRCPRYEQLPEIPLYSEQVVDTLKQFTVPFQTSEDESIITAAMINNYVKQHLIPPPEKKRYGREQLARLYCICLLKQAFTISEIGHMLDIQSKSYPFPVAYNYFCVELEKALQANFSTRDFSAPSSANHMTLESELVRSVALTFANRLFTAKLLQFYDIVKEQES